MIKDLATLVINGDFNTALRVFTEELSAPDNTPQ
jgi:hypothetical protein